MYMPTTNNTVVDKKKLSKFQAHTRSVDLNETSVSSQKTSNASFLKIGPAIPSDERKKLYKRSNTSLNLGAVTQTSNTQYLYDFVILKPDQNGSIIISRSQKQKEKDPDRITLDRKGLVSIPLIEGEERLRLLSLQHNLITNLEHFKCQSFPYLVFLDLYDNQLEKVCGLENIENLRVILMGKNRLKKIDGFQCLKQIEVLDLHGNKITQISGLSNLNKLKVLNLAGNQIRVIGAMDLNGLTALQELNLRRNRLKKLLGFADTPNLMKLFLSNNELKSIEDISSLAQSAKIKEISIENNPILLGGDCISFLVSYLPQLLKLNSMQINEQVKKAAMAWRRNKETTNTAFMDLTSDVCLNVKREEVISNARTNWELLRSQTRCLSTKVSGIPKVLKNLQPDTDFFLTPITKSEIKHHSKLRVKNLKVSVLPDKKLQLIRSSSQDTESLQNTSSCSISINDYFKLPPILVPIITKMEQETNRLRRSGSLSSLFENFDRSSYSCYSQTSNTSTDEEEIEEDGDFLQKKDFNHKSYDFADDGLIEDVEKCSPISEKEAKNTLNTDSSSNLSSSLSSITLPNNLEGESISLKKSERNIRSAHPSKSSQVLKLKARASTAKPKKRFSPPVVTKDREQGGDYLIEICGRYLNIYGQGALRFIDKSWNVSKAGDIITAKFNYLNFNNIVGALHKLKVRFPNVEKFVFKETNIHCLGQLNALAEAQGLSSLFIEEEGNPIYLKKWRTYAIFRLSHWGLKYINDVEVTKEEIEEANIEYQSLSDMVLWSLPDIQLEPLLTRLRIDIKQSEQTAKKWLLSADPELKSVVSKEALQWKKRTTPQEDLVIRQKAKIHISSLLEEMSHTVHKLRLLDHQGPSIIHEIVCNTLLDYSHMDLYMKQKLQELMNI
ncbi:leucine-rich repeat-containing protein 49 [Harmonia axyridis]|uniref:leucine-rich repeat-containing protein 49 n=1 Tax=Harmonia axyridis TaxID=115357 RepID=UPI001E278F07|nr:leucine-rich repeat-containing protein 49 [Harmonia axyridis]